MGKKTATALWMALTIMFLLSLALLLPSAGAVAEEVVLASGLTPLPVDLTAGPILKMVRAIRMTPST